MLSLEENKLKAMKCDDQAAYDDPILNSNTFTVYRGEELKAAEFIVTTKMYFLCNSFYFSATYVFNP